MKFNEFFLPIAQYLFAKKEDAELFVSASAFKETEMPDDVAAKFSSLFLTRERALTDEDILKKVSTQAKGQVFGSVDAKFKKLLDLLSPEDRTAIENEPNTLLKMELLGPAISNLGKNEDVKKLQETFRTTEREYKEKIKGLESTIQEKDSTFGNKLKEAHRDFILKNKLFAIPLAEEFQAEGMKNFLADKTLDSLKKNYVLESDEKDPSIILLRKNIDGLIKEVYDGNNLVTIDDVVKKEYEPFTKKSAASPDNSKSKQVELPKSDKPVQGMTVEQRRQAAAQGQRV